MSGRINITEAAFTKAANFLEQAQHLKKTFNNPSEKITESQLSYIEVDIEILSGSSFALRALINKVDETTRSEFRDLLDKIDKKAEKLQKICKDFEHRITSNQSSELKELEAKVKNLSMQVDVFYTIANQDDDSPLEQIQFYSKKIEQVRSTTGNQKILELLKSPADKLETLQWIAETALKEKEKEKATLLALKLEQSARDILQELEGLDSKNPQISEKLETYSNAIQKIRAQTKEERIQKILSYADEEITKSRAQVAILLKQMPQIPAISTPPTAENPSEIKELNLMSFMGTLFEAAKTLEEKSENGQNSEDAYLAAASLMTELSDKNLVFSMTGTEPRPISDRPFFHTFHIHKKEAPEKLTDDNNYGTNTWQDVEKMTGDERKRTVQRTLIEVAFAGLEDTIREGNDVREIFNMLQDLQLDAKDLPKDKKNIAFYLFERLYFNYLEACKVNTELPSPDHQGFKGDFGRNAFRDEADIRIPHKIKLDAIEQVRQELKQVWEVQF